MGKESWGGGSGGGFHLVLQLERFILATRHQKVGLLDEDLRIDWVVVLRDTGDRLKSKAKGSVRVASLQNGGSP
jgi:hypothetical protein